MGGECGTYVRRQENKVRILLVKFAENSALRTRWFNREYNTKIVGTESSVGIATPYGLDCPGIESRWGARFSASVPTGPGAHPASCKRGTGSLSRGCCAWGVALTTHALLSSRLRKE